MIEKVGHVRNPLTIIAIFAALAEVGGTAVLPLLQPITQYIYIYIYIYVWFLIVFPVGLVGTFFYVLYNKHHVLYAPSDFKDDSSFKDLLGRQTATERLETLNLEVAAAGIKQAATEDTPCAGSDEQTAADTTSGISALDIIERDYRATYLLAEELAFAKLSKDRGWRIDRHLISRGHERTPFDGVAETSSNDFVIEVTYSAKPGVLSASIRQKISRIAEFYDSLADDRRRRFVAVFAIVVVGDDAERGDRAMRQIRELASSFPFQIEIVCFRLDELRKEFRVH